MLVGPSAEMSSEMSCWWMRTHQQDISADGGALEALNLAGPAHTRRNALHSGGERLVHLRALVGRVPHLFQHLDLSPATCHCPHALALSALALSALALCDTVLTRLDLRGAKQPVRHSHTARL
jgi:hypothetical protein